MRRRLEQWQRSASKDFTNQKNFQIGSDSFSVDNFGFVSRWQLYLQKSLWWLGKVLDIVFAICKIILNHVYWYRLPVSWFSQICEWVRLSARLFTYFGKWCFLNVRWSVKRYVWELGVHTLSLWIENFDMLA